MDISHIAYIYVTYLEPLLKILFFAVVLIVVLHLFNSMRDGKKHSDIISFAFNGMLSLIKGVFLYAGLILAWMGKMLLKTIKLIFASVRDFFTSDI